MSFINLKKTRKCISVFVFSIVLLIPGCSKEQPKEIVVEKEKKEEIYDIAEAIRGDVVLTKRIEFTYSQKDSETLYFNLEGYTVRDIYVKKGDMVKKGDLLAEIDFGSVYDELEAIDLLIQEYEIAISDIKETFALIEDQADRMIASGELSEGDRAAYIEEAEEVYMEDLKEYEDNLTYQTYRRDYYGGQVESGRIYAGMDGMVGYVRNYSSTARTSKGQIVIEIYESDKCLFYMDEPEDAGLFTVGEEYTVRNLMGKDIPTEYLGVQEDGNACFEVKDTSISIDLNSKAYINKDYITAKDVVCIPERCLHQAGDVYYVYFVDENNIRSVQYVEPGLIGDYYAEIRSGISEGDVIVKR